MHVMYVKVDVFSYMFHIEVTCLHAKKNKLSVASYLDIEDT